MINAHFIAHELSNNAQSTVRYLLLIVCIILEQFLLNIFFTLKRLKLMSRGMPSGDFVNNSDEGYRTLVEKQNHTKPTLKQKNQDKG